MKLFLISQDLVADYDTYDSAVVSAIDENDARNIHPSEFVTHVTNGKWMGTYKYPPKNGDEYENEQDSWVRYCDIDKIKVEYLGETSKPRGVILASFNAG